MRKNKLLEKMVSKISFGTWGLSGDWGNKLIVDPVELIEYAFEKGINFFDTAPVYGGGKAEEYLGKSKYASKMIISTKVHAKRKPVEGENLDNYEYYDADYIRRILEESLKRLGRDSVDILQLHNWSEEWNKEAEYFLKPLQDLKDEGLIEGIGISVPNGYKDDMAEVLSLGIVDTIQFQKNPIDYTSSNNLLKKAQKYNVYSLVRSIFASGHIVPELYDSKDFIKADKRKDRYGSYSELKKKVVDWSEEHKVRKPEVNRDILAEISSELGDKGSMIIGMTSKEQINLNTNCCVDE